MLLFWGPIGTPSNSAIQKYVNAKKVPHLHVYTGATKWDDPTQFPWTMGWQPNYRQRRDLRRHILQTKPDAKIAVLYQNDDFGKDFLEGFEKGLGAKAKTMIVETASYETTDPTVDSQIMTLKASGARVFRYRRAEGRRTGDPQSVRHRLETGGVSEQRFGLDRIRADTRRPGKIDRPDLGRIPQGSTSIRPGKTTRA